MYAISALMAIRTKTGTYQRSDAEKRSGSEISGKSIWMKY